ncbi:crosslink repair DNA glycosylase YcaQ family protein, partial [Spirillospora sp. NPDC049652]
HGPWALALAGRLRERYGVDAQAMHADDGIVIRIPDMDDPPGMDLCAFDADEIERVVVDELGGSALFAARFRECAARSLLLPRRRPDKRMPLWQQRQRAAQLLSVAGKYPSFPIVLETMRECLQDVFDVPGLVQLMRDLSGRKVRMVEVETNEPSPYARSLLFHYVGAFMYEGDSPLAERRAQALALDTALLSELLGQADLRELLDPEVVADTERELQRLAPERRAHDLEGVADLLRTLGPLTTAEIGLRLTGPHEAAPYATRLEEERRVIRVRVAGEERWAAIEDAGRLRDALGVPLPVGVPEAFLEPVDDPLGDLVSRYARTHGPFRADTVAARFGLGAAVATEALRRLAAAGRVVEGEFLPVEAVSGPLTSEWCDSGVLRTLRRRSLARLRAEVEPSPPEALGRFLPAWHGITGGSRLRGLDALVQAVEQLQGSAVPASALESLILPSRVPGYSPAMLDELTSSGEVVWAGQGSLPGGDGWVALYLADTAPLLMPEPAEITLTPVHQAVLELLEGGGALFFRMLSDRVNRERGLAVNDADLVTAVWDLVWAGLLTNDTLAPLRAALGSGRPAHRARATRRGRPVLPSRTGPPTVAGRWWPLPERETTPTARSHALAESLLDRYGIVIRGAVAAERTPGGFSAVYPVLRAFEETGRCRRGYFVEGLGAAQFALPGAVDRLRALRPSPPPAAPPPPASLWETPAPDAPDGRWDAPGPSDDASGGRWESAAEGTSERWGSPAEDVSGGGGGSSASDAFPDRWDEPDASRGPTTGRSGAGRPGHGRPPSLGGSLAPVAATRGQESGERALVLAAADPANVYGAALPWPDRPDEAASGHKPGRKAGALVVLIGGRLVLYVERGGKTLLTWDDDPDVLQPAVDALALAVREGALGKLTVERADGEDINDSPLAAALEAAGFHPTPRGLRLRA